MLIITGSSPKQQLLGQRNAPCAACRQETPHRFLRNYSVKHLFWFPLFSMHTAHGKICERCNLFTPTDTPPPGTAPPKPLLHRMGFIFPLGVVMFPFLLLPFAAVSGGGSAASMQADVSSVRSRFHADDDDRAAQGAVQDFLNQLDLGFRGPTVRATSAAVNGRRVRLLTVQYSKLKRVRDDDRVRLLQVVERIADTKFPDDEVFVGLQGRILWGGHSHRKAAEAWDRQVDESTPNPETSAFAALRALETAAPAAAPAARPAEPTAAAARP